MSDNWQAFLSELSSFSSLPPFMQTGPDSLSCTPASRVWPCLCFRENKAGVDMWAVKGMPTVKVFMCSCVIRGIPYLLIFYKD